MKKFQCEPVLRPTKTPNYFLPLPLLLLCKGANLSNHQNLPQSCLPANHVRQHTYSHNSNNDIIIFQQNCEKIHSEIKQHSNLNHNPPIWSSKYTKLSTVCFFNNKYFEMIFQFRFFISNC